jgi:hypothetical protein
MKAVPASPDHDHRFVREALPWYINGTLDAATMARVREHTAVCVECRLEMDRESRLAGAMCESTGVDMMPQPSLARVMARIDAHEARWSWLSRLLRPWSSTLSQRALLLTAGCQAAALALLAGVLATVGTDSRPAAGYRTLSNESATERHDGPLLSVVFDSHLTAEALRGLLEQIDGSIVRGPDETGLFTVELPADTDAPDAIATWLRAQPGIRLAEVAVSQGN